MVDSLSRRIIGRMAICGLLALGTAATTASAQSSSALAPLFQAPAPQPAPEMPPLLAGSAGVGLAVTTGNTDTSSFNLTFRFAFDPKNPHRTIAEALYLRSSNADELIVDRLAFAGRHEYAFTDRAFTFAQVRYLRDPFKAIEYLVAPVAGLGYKLVKPEPTTLPIDAAVGASWERDTDRSTVTNGALNVGESFLQKLSSTASISQTATALWKTDDFGDALYTFAAGVTAPIHSNITIKVELLETYKTRPPVSTIQKQDLSLITSLVYNFTRP